MTARCYRFSARGHENIKSSHIPLWPCPVPTWEWVCTTSTFFILKWLDCCHLFHTTQKGWLFSVWSIFTPGRRSQTSKILTIQNVNTELETVSLCQPTAHSHWLTDNFLDNWFPFWPPLDRNNEIPRNKIFFHHILCLLIYFKRVYNIILWVCILSCMWLLLSGYPQF